MKKTLFFVSLLLGCCNLLPAQSYLGKTEVQKLNRQAVVLPVDFPQDIVEGAVRDKMEQLGQKGKEDKGLLGLGKGGFLIFKNVKISDLEQDHLDLYFRAERVSKQQKDRSLLYLVLAKGDNDFVSDMTDDKLMERAKDFMNKLLPHVAAYDLEVQITNQDKTVQKVQKNIDNLYQDSVSLDKRIKALQEKLEQNRLDKEAQIAELEKQRLELEALKEKRKS